MKWELFIKKKAAKGIESLLKSGRNAEAERLYALLDDMRDKGPVRAEYPNYSKLSNNQHHCHIGHSWVVCWEVENNKLKIIEVYYVGSRENAPY